MELPTRLETERLTLRLFEESDAVAYEHLLDESREHLTRALGWGPERFEDAPGQIRELRERHQAKIALPLGIFAKDGGGFLGAIGLVRPDWEAGSCELGIWLGVKALNQGVASEAARALTNHAFEVMGLKQLIIKTDPANTAIRGAALRHGFTFEGVHTVEPGPGGPPSAVAVYVRLAE